MASFIFNVTFDCADPGSLGRFWSEVTGYELVEERDDLVRLKAPDKRGVRHILFVQVPEPKATKNRVHIDIRVAGEPPWDMRAREVLIRAKSAELADAGAVIVREESWDGQLSHIIMLDPEGNEFCVA